MKAMFYGQHFDFAKYNDGTRLLGAKFKTNHYCGINREYYIYIYLWKYDLVFGKFNNYN